MEYHESKIRGVFEIRIEPKEDERGVFARTWCQKEFEERGLNPRLVQCSLSFNTKKGTLRGMHYQAEPYAEAKLVRCAQGSIYDAVIDLRAQSPTFRNWISVVLDAKKRNMVYIPEGCAHGFLTLEDGSEVFYQMSQFYDAGSARGVRWDDPAFRIAWPQKVTVISERDRTYPDFEYLP
jgi:dTDP-4-dehydrorhamnose 3,5-epimerase